MGLKEQITNISEGLINDLGILKKLYTYQLEGQLKRIEFLN